MLFTAVSSWRYRAHYLWVTGKNLSPYMVSASVLLLLYFLKPLVVFYASKIKNINMGQPKPYGLYSHMTPKIHKIFIIEGHLISNVQNIQSWSFSIFWIQLWWVLPHEMFDDWFILALGVIFHILRGSSITMSPTLVYLLKSGT